MSAEERRELACVECGRSTDVFAHGWRAVLAGGIEDEIELAIYCPGCAHDEFGDRGEA